MKIRSISLPDELDQQVIRAAGKQPYSSFVRDLLEHSLTGVDRMAALDAVASEGLREFADVANAPRALNATEVIASPESCADGHGRLAALEKIAAGRK